MVPRLPSWQHPVGECPSFNWEAVVLVIAKVRAIGGPNMHVSTGERVASGIRSGSHGPVAVA